MSAYIMTGYTIRWSDFGSLVLHGARAGAKNINRITRRGYNMKSIFTSPEVEDLIKRLEMVKDSGENVNGEPLLKNPDGREAANVIRGCIEGLARLDDIIANTVRALS